MQASVAKLETSVSLLSDKLELKVYGFNNKLPALLSKVLATAKSFLPTDDRFKVFVLPLILITPFYVWFKFDLCIDGIPCWFLACPLLSDTLTGC